MYYSTTTNASRRMSFINARDWTWPEVFRLFPPRINRSLRNSLKSYGEGKVMGGSKDCWERGGGEGGGVALR